MNRQIKRHTLRTLVLTATAACIMAVGALAVDTGVITGDVVNARTGPGTDYDRVEQLAKGKRVTILAEEGDWFKISWNNSTGYISKSYIALNSSGSTASAQSGSPNATVTGGSTINVRTGPGTGYSRVTMVGEGKRVTTIAKADDWFQIEFDGKTGYIFGDYLKPDDGVAATLATVEPTAEPAAEPAAETAEEPPAEAVSSDEPAEIESDRKGIITGGTINVRTGPDTEYSRITQVCTGKRVTILGEENGWYRISFDGKTGYVRGDYLYEGDSLPASSVGEQVAAMASQYLGVRYVSGGASPSGFDCSGFTLYLYKQFGYSLPHTASGQYARCGYKVSKSELQPGDLVFFTSPGAGGKINHTGVYIGNGQVVHARYSVGRVYLNSLSESYYTKNYVGAIRIA